MQCVDAQSLRVSPVPLSASKDFGGRVNCIFQDKTGFIWIGKETGLFRYDGNELKSYRFDPKDSFSISSNNILTITEDSKGNLWIGTKGGGLNFYDRASGRFKHYLHNDLDPQSISFNEVFVIQPDGAGHFWLGTDGGGLNYFDPSSGKFINFKKSDIDATGLQSNKILSILPASNGKYWIGTWAGGLHLFDPKNRKFAHIGNGTSFANANVFSIAEVSEGILWLATFNQGLIAYDVKGDRFSTIVASTVVPIVRHLKVGKKGKIWISTSSGLLYFSSPSSTYKLILLEGSPNARDFSFVLEDNANLVWVGLKDGLIGTINQRPKNFSFFQDSISFSKSPVYSIFTDKASGNLYFSSWKVLIKYDPATKKQKIFSSPVNQLTTIVEIAGTDSLLCTSSGSLHVFNKATGVFSKPVFSKESPASVLNREIWTVASTSPLVYWVGASEVAYQIVFDKKTGLWNVMKVYYSGQGESLPASHFIGSFLNDPKGNFWIGTLGGGLSQLKPGADRFTFYLHDVSNSKSISDNFIECLTSDAEGNIWAATHAGLNLFDWKTSSFKNITVGDGLSSDWISAVSIDSKKRIWVSTQKGISLLLPDLKQIQNFDVEDGLPSNAFLSRAAATDNDGNLYFGSTGGLVWFHPDNIIANPYIPPAVLVDFKVNDQPVGVGIASILKQSIEETREIKLDHNQSSFSFKMAALSYFNPKKNRIKYKLNGYETEWKLAGPDQLAVYVNIPPGSYRFSFLVSNEDGTWNTNEKSINIIISKAHWLSGWAISIYSIIVFALAFWIYSILRKKPVSPDIQVTEVRYKKIHNNDLIQPACVVASPAEMQFLQKAILIVEENIADPDFKVEQLSDKLFISRPQLYRKINAITGVTVTDFIKEIRLKRAAQLILQKPGNISEIAYQVGFNDPKYFSKCFKQQFGVSPGSYKEPGERILPPQ